MSELEEQLEMSANKNRASLAAAREEGERQRRSAFEAVSATNDLKLKHEALRRQLEALQMELNSNKDALEDAEKRIASQKVLRFDLIIHFDLLYLLLVL